MTETKKPYLILDLDETIIHSTSKEELAQFSSSDITKMKKDYKTHKMKGGYYTVAERPGLQEFLDYAFENFTVSVWTAASKDYALFIIDEIVIAGKPERELDWIFFSYHCDISTRRCRSIKNLKLIWEMFNLEGYTPDNTVIMDDHPKVYKSQKENCIYMYPFQVEQGVDPDDDFLERLIPHLKMIHADIMDGKGVDTTSVNEQME